jgi:dipeptidyl aminopeptidase/acylaminoacyl peptidase
VTQQVPGVSGMEHELTIERIAVAGGEPHVVCRFPCWIHSLAWSNDGKTLLFVAPVNRTSQSSYAVYAVPAQGGEPRRIALGDESCAGGLRQPRGSARAVVSAGAGLETRLCLLDPTTGTLETTYPATEKDRESDLGAWDARPLADGGVVMAVARSTGPEPWEVWAGGAEDAGQTGTLRAISSHQDALAGIVWGRQEALTWTAPDGWELDGLLVRPPGDAGEGALPTVVLVHGGPYGRWSPGFNLGWSNWAQWLALAGYAVLMPNPRGGYGHGEAFAAAARGDVGGADYRDIMAMVDAAVEHGIADPTRLGIGGWSQGGFMSAWAVTQTRRFKAAVMGAGVSDWRTMVMTSDLPGFEAEISSGAPWDGPEQRRPVELSPIYHARAASTPVLILHGEKDARVPLNQAIGFHRALRAHDVPVELVVYPREPHGIGERNHQIDVLKRVRSWYDRWLKV